MYNAFLGKAHVVLTITRQVSLVEKALLTHPEHPSSAQDFSCIRVAQSIVIFAIFVGIDFSLCPFTFGNCSLCFSIYCY